MIPFFIYYSMFGFQRIGDLIWAAGDMRAKGFLIGGTAGRTTLNGEGLQHQDGHSLLNAIAFPDGPLPTIRPTPTKSPSSSLTALQKLYEDGETAIYYITVENDNYADAGDAGRRRRRHHPRDVQAVEPRRGRRRRSE